MAAAAAAALSLVQFAMFDSKPVIEAESARPAAMFHDVEARVGLKLAATPDVREGRDWRHAAMTVDPVQ